MNRKEVLVDTVFLQKLSCEGKNLDIFKKVLLDLEYKPVVHPYISASELDMFSYYDKLVKEGFIRVADYNEFLKDDEDKTLYELYFKEIHNKLCEYLEAAGGKKQLEKLVLPKGQDIFSYRKAAMSLGDVHIILMAFFSGMPIVLTKNSELVGRILSKIHTADIKIENMV